MPENFDTIVSELGISKEELDINHQDFRRSVNEIKNKYQGEIPREWISPVVPDLPPLQKAKEVIKEKNLPISLPLIDNSSLDDNIKVLRNHFFFQKLPDDFIEELELPEPELALLPKIF